MNENPVIKKIFNYLNDSEYNIFLYITIIFIIASFTYFYNNSNPPYQFWDENYHVASAQKYIDGVMFMEPHPPLGKLIIAFGEVRLGKNKKLDLSSFTKTDYASSFPSGYSFKGVRFFSSFFALLSAIVFFCILFQMFKKALLSFLLTFLYLFDNAMIVHSRAAMLDGIQIFFILCALLYFVNIIQNTKKHKKINYFILGILTGLAVSVKVNSLILILLPLFLFGYQLYFFRQKGVNIRKYFFAFVLKSSVYFAGTALIFFTVFYIHFAIGSRVIDNRYYKASPAYIKILQAKQNKNIGNFFIMLKDNLKFSADYEKGVPKLDRCKADENGSYPMEWLLGGKTINYRWNKDNDKVSYLYLVSNPVIWFSGLAGIILALALVLSKIFFGMEIKNKKIFSFMVMFVILYLGYMASVLRIDRVMYLYHYFIPLLFSLILASLVLYYIFETEINKNDLIIYLSLGIFCLIIIVVFFFFSPFTYYISITTKEFIDRTWFDFWGLKYVN